MNCFYVSNFTVMHCHPLSVSVAVVLTLIFAIGLAETSPANWTQIDDEGKVIEEITDQMRKITHVSVQTWKGWNPGELFGGWFSILGGFQTLLSVIFLILQACLVLPCLASLICKVSLQPHRGHS
jgi:hypothetical protein